MTRSETRLARAAKLRDQAKRLRYAWTFGDERAAARADQLEREADQLETSALAEDAVDEALAKGEASKLDAAVAAKLAEVEAAKAAEAAELAAVEAAKLAEEVVP